jgi:hypothetical protein
MGKAISLRVLSLRAQAGKVVKQIETFCSSDPIMRRSVRRPRREASNLRKRQAVDRGSKSGSSLTLTTPIREDSQTGVLRRRDLTAWLAAEPKSRPLFVKQRLPV